MLLHLLKRQQHLWPAQHQDRQPGIEEEMHPHPVAESNKYRPGGKLKGKVALITGGDSGIGRAVAIAFAKEGADVALVYLNEYEDADLTRTRVEEMGRRALPIAGDVGREKFCIKAVEDCVRHYSKIDILVNNAGEMHAQEQLEDVSSEQLRRTFETNIFSMFYLSKQVLHHMQEGGVIINTASVTAYRGSSHLIDYSATKGAIVAFTRSLALSLVPRKIRVNAVAPGPVWTPLIPAGYPKEEIKDFGSQVPMERAAEPEEIAPSYVFLASQDSSYMTGQVLHPNGGEIIGG